MQPIVAVTFWLCLAGLAYNYVGYPIGVCLAAKWKLRRSRLYIPAEEHLPEITVVIAAFNAEYQIRERINDLLACDYPAGKLNILVASDGSTDRTVWVVESFKSPNIRALDCDRRKGKAATLAVAIPHACTEIILFTDATTRFEPLAIRRLVAHFANPDIGLVTGHISIIDERGKPAESFYWRCETMVRRSEATLGMMLGASGAIYAIRRHLFVKPLCPIINDDMIFPMLVKLRHGCGFAYAETAVAYAVSSGGMRSEFTRRSRIGAGAFQCLPALREMWQWQHRKQAFAFVSHKLLRWISPFLLVVLLATNLYLSASPGYRWMLYLQTYAYVLAVIGLFTSDHKHFLARLSRIAASFAAMNLALMVGFFRWLSAPQNVVWNPTARPPIEPAAWNEQDDKRSAA